jgi:hypothetical protein
MQSSRRLMSVIPLIRRGLLLHRDLGARGETHLAEGHHPLAGGQTFCDHGLRPDRAIHRDCARLHGVVGLDHEHQRAVLAGLHCLRRHDDRVRLDAQRDRDVDELARPEALLCVGEAGLDREGAGVRVGRVLDVGDRALLRCAVIARDGRGHRHGACRHRFLQLGEVALRQGESHVNRAHLIDRDQGRRVCGLDRAAELLADGAEPSVDRGLDHGIGQLDLVVVDHGLIGADRGLRRGDRSARGIDLLLGGKILLRQRAQAVEFALRVGQLGLVALEHRLRPSELRLSLPAVEHEQQVAGLHLLTVGHRDLGDLTVDARLRRRSRSAGPARWPRAATASAARPRRRPAPAADEPRPRCHAPTGPPTSPARSGRELRRPAAEEPG